MNEQIEKAIESVVACAMDYAYAIEDWHDGGSSDDRDLAEKELALAKAHLKFLINKEINGQ